MSFFVVSFLGCEDRLPPVMKNNADCKKMKQSCSKLKNKCSETLSVAIGNSKNAKKCKNALKDVGVEKVDTFCARTCKKCGKFDLNVWYHSYCSSIILLTYA